MQKPFDVKPSWFNIKPFDAKASAVNVKPFEELWVWCYELVPIKMCKKMTQNLFDLTKHEILKTWFLIIYEENFKILWLQ